MRLSFVIDLRSSEFKLIEEIQGPLFSKFFPNNNQDNVELKFEKGVAKFWFERRGYIDESGLIKYDFNKKELKEDLIFRQGIIQGGPLFGELIISSNYQTNLTSQDLNNNDDIMQFSKSIVKIIALETQKILDILRYNFGHYWIIENINWDSRKCNLGFHCKNLLHLKLFDEENAIWLDLVPESPRATINLTSKISSDFSDYLTEKNWLKFKGLVNQGHSPSFAQKQLIKAFITLDSGDLEKAFIDAVTVLEIALDKYYKSINNKSEKIGKLFNRIKDIGNKEQLSNIFINHDTVATIDLEAAIDAIDIRNKIVHEGYTPRHDDKVKLEVLLKLNSLLIDEPFSNLISSNTGNSLENLGPSVS